MSLASDSSIDLNIYDEVMNLETVLDLSGQELKEVPDICNSNLLILYLHNNSIVALPDDLFPTLKYLMWLDLRDNRITDLPKSIRFHQGLTHLLLQNNCLTSLPNELGTVSNLKVLQINGNPLMYPPREVISAGVKAILSFLNDKFMEDDRNMQALLQSDSASVSTPQEDGDAICDLNLELNKNSVSNKMTVEFHERGSHEEVSNADEEHQMYPKLKGKCPKLDKSRHQNVPSYYQSSKYLKPLRADSRLALMQKMKQSHLRELAEKKHKDLLAMRDKILQDNKNLEFLRNWRQTYRHQKMFTDPNHRLDAAAYPYGTHPEYMTLLSREDIEKDLPDKYRKNLVRRSRRSVPRKADDVQLARSIKQLFDNLEAIHITKPGLTPRTEQKMLLNEIHKITEIKRKLMELSSTNMRSVSAD